MGPLGQGLYLSKWVGLMDRGSDWGGTEVEGNGTARTVFISEVEMGRTYRAEV